MWVIKFAVWAILITGLGTVFNMVISMPVSLYAERRWGTLDSPAKPIGNVFPRASALTFLLGAVLSVLLSYTLFKLTWTYFSDHWVYQLVLLGSLAGNAAKQQKVHLRVHSGPPLSGLTGGRFCAVMFGGYFWGAILILIALNIFSRFT